jgi:peptidoglycan/LPS O-acetylase OafA/YrhL
VATVDLVVEEQHRLPPPVDTDLGTSAPAPAPAPAKPSRPHVAGLDGIRAVAVIGVLGFHAGVGWFGGGLLGVDIFFVLSGYLITSLLVEEWTGSGTVAFLRFYERRARRLLPGLFLLMLLVAAYARWFAEPSTLSTLRGDAFSTLAYVANWRFILSGQSYFVRYGPPSPLLHTWSLAVEEQFYVVWPALALFVLRHRGRRGLAVVASAGIVLSTSVTVVLFNHGVDISRLYYGTDTRIQEIMTGALLAVAMPRIRRWVAGGKRDGGLRSPGAAVALVGGLGAVVLLWLLHTLSGQSRFLYDGGFLAVAVTTAAVIAVVVVRPRTLVSRILAVGVLGYIGRISYGLYLYHFPLFLMIDNQRTGLSGPALLAARLAATAVAAVASYHLVEMPIRNRRALPGWHLVAAIPIGLAVVVLAVVTATVAPAPARAEAGATVRRQANGSRLFAVPATPPPGLAAGQKVKVLLLGDSMAETLGAGLSVQAGAWGASVDNQGEVGCDLDPDSTVNIEGSIGPAAPGCTGWQQRWRADIDRADPDVVAVELGRWEVSDRIVDGAWTQIGQPAWDHLYASELGTAIRILSSRGAHVVIFTLPYIQQTTEAPDGTPWDINQPIRTDEYNALVRATVAHYPHVASVIDLNRMLDPAGSYTPTLHGVDVRDDDQEHVSVYGGMLLRPMILPTLVRLGLRHEQTDVAQAAAWLAAAKAAKLRAASAGGAATTGD